jgi:dihydropteroate synthase
MHSRGNPATMQNIPPMVDPLREVTEGLAGGDRDCHRLWSWKEKIIVDPGIGFGKTAEQNLELIGSVDRLHIHLDGRFCLARRANRSFD